MPESDPLTSCFGTNYFRLNLRSALGLAQDFIVLERSEVKMSAIGSLSTSLRTSPQSAAKQKFKAFVTDVGRWTTDRKHTDYPLIKR
jgi:hypothetical protein